MKVNAHPGSWVWAERLSPTQNRGALEPCIWQSCKGSVLDPCFLQPSLCRVEGGLRQRWLRLEAGTRSCVRDTCPRVCPLGLGPGLATARCRGSWALLLPPVSSTSTAPPESLNHALFPPAPPTPSPFVLLKAVSLRLFTPASKCSCLEGLSTNELTALTHGVFFFFQHGGGLLVPTRPCLVDPGVACVAFYLSSCLNPG